MVVSFWYNIVRNPRTAEKKHTIIRILVYQEILQFLLILLIKTLIYLLTTSVDQNMYVWYSLITVHLILDEALCVSNRKLE